MSNASSQMRVTIASPPDREKLVAEIFHENEQWAEVHQERSELTLELYPRRDGKPWEFGLEDAVSALVAARKRLVGVGEK